MLRFIVFNIDVRLKKTTVYKQKSEHLKSKYQ